MKEVLNNLLHSLDNKPTTGYSAKKLTAFAIVICVLAAHIKWITLGNFDQLEMVLTIDYSFVAVLFGINEYGKKLINKKNEE
jgi:hypothetical protein